MLNRGCEQIKWKMEMIYAAETEKKNHKSAFHGDELTFLMYYGR